jgi:hypothetical protein
VKSLNFVDGELSCVGKSLFTCLLIEAYRHFGRDYHLVDLDRFNPDVWRRYCRHSDMNDIYFSDDPDELYRTDRLLELVQERDVVINLPARVSRQLNNWLSVNLVLDDYPVCRWFVSSLAPNSWEIFSSQVEYYGESLEHILVVNLNWGKVLTESQQQFCNRHDLSIVKIPQFQLSPAHLTYIANNPSISYGELLVGLNKRGQMLLQAYMQQIFYQLSARISPTLPVATKLASSAAIEPDF